MQIRQIFDSTEVNKKLSFPYIELVLPVIPRQLYPRNSYRLFGQNKRNLLGNDTTMLKINSIFCLRVATFTLRASNDLLDFILLYHQSARCHNVNFSYNLSQLSSFSTHKPQRFGRIHEREQATETKKYLHKAL